MNTNINRSSSKEEKTRAAEVVFSQLTDYFFDKVNFISLPFSMAMTGTTSGVTDTTNFNGVSRLTDTGEGKFLSPNRSSRMRCQFYVNNPANIEGYILSPVVYDSFSSLNSFSSMSVLRAYIGLKIHKGVVSVAVKQAGGQEELYPTPLQFSGTGATDTFVLEIKYNISFSEIFIDDALVGSYTTDFIGSSVKTSSYLPLLSPMRTAGGTVNISIENYQLIQDK